MAEGGAGMVYPNAPDLHSRGVLLWIALWKKRNPQHLRNLRPLNAPKDPHRERR